MCKECKKLIYVVFFSASDGEFDTEIVFALDYSSSVSDENFQKEVNFVKQLAQSWDVPPEDSIVTVVYGHSAKVVTLDSGKDNSSVELTEVRPEAWIESGRRRMDQALLKVADYFRGRSKHNQNGLHQLVILVTAGKQVSGTECNEDNPDPLVSAYEKLSSENIKIVVVSVGLAADFKELGHLVKRPHFLFQLSSFDDMTPEEAQSMAAYMKKTAGEPTVSSSSYM